jgi:hypothetical protein
MLCYVCYVVLLQYVVMLLCYVMFVVLSYVTLRYVMFVTVCFVVLCSVVLCCVMLCYRTEERCLCLSVVYTSNHPAHMSVSLRRHLKHN